MKKGKRFISIKTKLLSIILPVVIIIMIVLTSLSYNVSKDVIQSNAQELLKTSVKGQAAEIEAWLNQNLTSFSVEKQALEQMGFDEEQIQTYLNAYYKFDSNYPNGICLANADGQIYQAETAKKIILRKPDEYGNYINNGSFADDEDLSDDVNWAFYTALGGVAEAEIKDGGLVIRTADEGSEDYSVQLVQLELPMMKGAGYRLSFDAYADMDRSMKVGISVPDREYIRYFGDETVDDEFMQEVAQQISSNELDMSEICGNMSVFEEVEGTERILVSYIASQTVYQDLNRVRNVMVLFGLVSVLILTVLMERIVHIVIRPVKKLTDVIKRMTDGDFTIRSCTCR